MFPLDAPRAVGVLPRLVAATGEVDAISRVAAAAVELHGLPGVELPADFLRFGERARGVGLAGAGEEEGEKAYKQTGKHAATSKKIRMLLILQEMPIVASPWPGEGGPSRLRRVHAMVSMRYVYVL